MNWKNIDKSKAIKVSLVSIIGITALISVFEAGVLVGYNRAAFSYRSGDNYYRAFTNRRPMMPMDADDLPSSYGAAGKIIKVDLPIIIIEDRGNIEKIILVTDNTIIKQFSGDASSSAIKADDYAIVVGTPNSKSQIEAKLIRILPPPEDLPIAK